MSNPKAFTCNTCSLVFDNSQAQRKHMREPWHVYNLKRRMASLSPISADTYAESVATSLVSNKQEASDAGSSSVAVTNPPEEESYEEEPVEESDDIEDSMSEDVPINRCLFCIIKSDTLETNFEHMSSDHGLYIPEIEHLASLESIVRYLRTVIIKYKECLYCGITKQSTEGIQRHMLDKGHCMINLEREPELLEFWEFSDSEGDETDEEVRKAEARKPQPPAYKDLNEGEYALPSGKVVGSKGKARETRARRAGLAAKEPSGELIIKNPTHKTGTTPSTNPTDALILIQGGNQNRAIAVRDAKGLIGVSDQQIQTLVTVHRKMQRQQAIIKAAAGWADELGGRSQKHFKTKMNLRAG
ncbi:hypothetical protein P154DRAFT_570020 [Amniculicola lignicola CBS 123094]|uniref:C2H2-type domain-containing protein n=1 Tax=Amniculicola lignicola CBS 123094 TaxID=1392246 RepID=A0A6A5WXU3_9PLEO|nr:hypothetical protein P154DRAFT_570020 [Amniculicola lignicola CBS 123094]